MRIIRPYGSSRSLNKGEAVHRVLILNKPKGKERDIPEFAGSDNELVIAQWISAIDKIARKPSGQNKATRVQRDFREKLGDSCWSRLIDGKRKRLQASSAELGKLSNIWRFKIHPYPNGEWTPRKKDASPPSAKGRWYEKFVKDCEPEEIDENRARQIAELIDSHLYEHELRIGPHSKPKQKGRIEARAESIKRNTLCLARPGQTPDTRQTSSDENKTTWSEETKTTWSEEEKMKYLKGGDPVELIWKKAKESEDSRKERRKEAGERFRWSDAAEVLFEHWAKVFREPATGNVIGLKEALQDRRWSGLLALHGALKECYRRLLKRARKDTREQRKQNPNERPLSDLLPRDLEGALHFSGLLAKNAELAELVRLGKIIHYEASRKVLEQAPASYQKPTQNTDQTAATETNAEDDGDDRIVGPMTDTPAAVLTRWPEPDALSRSPFWQSSGQAEIKRAEAFVRIWRHALAIAGLTLRDWVSFSGDILAGEDYDRIKDTLTALRAAGPAQDHFIRKFVVLFGKRVSKREDKPNGELGLRDVNDRIAVVRSLIVRAENLRHAAFHFAGRGQLLTMLSPDQQLSGQAERTARALWHADVTERGERFKKTLRGAHVESYFTKAQVESALGLLLPGANTELPLPRFSRVLARRNNAWKAIRLPEPANLRALEKPARLCQYTLLRFIYQRGFREWLKNQKGSAISHWWNRAVERSTTAAQNINAKGDKAAQSAITSKASKLPMPSDDDDILDFFFHLSAATASEMRVQSGYQSDRDNAREQAKFIDDLLCDVVVLAFSDYLKEKKLEWLLTLSPDLEPPKQPNRFLDDMKMPKDPLAAEQAEGWQRTLYLMLHLLPVETVGQLLHQLFKWNIAATREKKLWEHENKRRERLEATMALYLDMHDAKFEGAYALAGCEEFADLFQSKAGFERLSAKASLDEPDRRVPQRGLREIMRFGHLPVIGTMSRGTKIEQTTVRAVDQMEEAPERGESQIALLHRTREQLHAKWIKQKKNLDAQELDDYCAAVGQIAEHRVKSNTVNLVDHIKAYRLVMRVVGRLVDFAGLFERDLYFVTLALLHRHGRRPADLLSKEGKNALSTGRIIAVLDELYNSSKAPEVLEQLNSHFSKVWLRMDPIRLIRNALYHFRMLEESPPPLKLTDWVDQTRTLMRYDRKLKNAVSKSVIDLLDREGITLHWTIKTEGAAHSLADPTLRPRSAEHLGGKRLKLKNAKSWDKGRPIEERLHGISLIDMIAVAFQGKALPAPSVLDDLPHVDWEASATRRAGTIT